MAVTFQQVVSWLYRAIAATILGGWSLFVLGLTAATALSSGSDLIPLIANPSLLTFLVSRLVVVLRPPTVQPGVNARTNSSIAHWIASVDHGSPHGAFVLLMLSFTWLWHFTRVLFALFTLTLIGGVAALTIYLDQNSEAQSADGTTATSDHGGTSAAANATRDLVPVLEEFNNSTGIDPDFLLTMAPAGMLITFAVVIWAGLITLFMYIGAHTLNSLRVVLASSSEDWAARGRVNQITNTTPVTNQVIQQLGTSTGIEGPIPVTERVGRAERVTVEEREKM